MLWGSGRNIGSAGRCLRPLGAQRVMGHEWSSGKREGFAGLGRMEGSKIGPWVGVVITDRVAQQGREKEMKTYLNSVVASCLLMGFVLRSTVSFADTSVRMRFESKARCSALYGEVFKAAAKMTFPLTLVVGVKGIIKHTAKDFKKSWQMARTGVIQSKLGDALAKGHLYHQQTGMRKVRTSAFYLARGIARVVAPHSVLFHAASSAWRNLKAGSSMLSLGRSARQQKLEARAEALANGWHSFPTYSRGRGQVFMHRSASRPSAPPCPRPMRNPSVHRPFRALSLQAVGEEFDRPQARAQLLLAQASGGSIGSHLPGAAGVSDARHAPASGTENVPETFSDTFYDAHDFFAD